MTDRKVLDAYYNMGGEVLKLPVLDEHHRLIRVRIEAVRKAGEGL